MKKYHKKSQARAVQNIRRNCKILIRKSVMKRDNGTYTGSGLKEHVAKTRANAHILHNASASDIFKAHLKTGWTWRTDLSGTTKRVVSINRHRTTSHLARSFVKMKGFTVISA